MKDWNDPEVVAFMKQVQTGGGGASKKKMNAQGEDLTVDGYINKHGGIYSHCDKKVYTTKSSYMEHLKANNKVILDF
jgi:hypothetical protein